MAQRPVRSASHRRRPPLVIVVDASVWMSSYIVGEQYHGISRQLLRRATYAGNLIAGPATLLPEIGGALVRRLNDVSFALEVMTNLLTREDVTLFDVDRTLASVSAQVAAELRLRGYDAVYVALASSLNVPLVTLDDDHLIRAHDSIVVWTPESALRELGN